MIVDGVINWGEGGARPSAKGFDVGAREKAIYDWVRQVRGGVLGGAFTIERHISAAIIYFMLGNRVMRNDVQSAFDEGLLTPLTFERRINAFLLIAPHFLAMDEVSSLKGELNELRKIRNAMAHKPFWFHPELSDNGEVMNLVPMIQIGKTPRALTSSFIAKINKQIASLIDRTYKLSEAVGEREVV